ncbi:PR domain zinc finger protein 10-like isoform X3 [Schistocerca cancellata]|uniref:PR domain zinc finger protein 10-like isoform X3 n=1 Tax=Schistocerca cancellata TaxID=274614 RepID=UPI0021179697|nr:PR domain zinc finger protein 10-like isoform X3 [Schistocerca cancellata]
MYCNGVGRVSMDSVGGAPDDEMPATDLVDEWVVNKGHVPESRFLYLTVEYVGGQSGLYEPGAPFSPQPSTSLPEFDSHINPLDPNMSSAAQYSPPYTGQVGEPPPASGLANGEVETVLYQSVASSLPTTMPQIVHVSQSEPSSPNNCGGPLSAPQQVTCVEQQSDNVGVQLLVSQLHTNGETLTLDDQQFGSVLQVLKNEGSAPIVTLCENQEKCVDAGVQTASPPLLQQQLQRDNEQPSTLPQNGKSDVKLGSDAAANVPDDLWEWECFCCAQIFKSSSYLQKHLNNSSCFKFDGEHYGMQLNNRSAFRPGRWPPQQDAIVPKHIRRVRAWHIARQYPCHRCGLLFTKSSSLNRHLLMLHVPAYRRACRRRRVKRLQRRRVASRKSRPKRRSRSILCNNTTKQCDYCGLRFGLASLLELHSLLHHHVPGSKNTVSDITSVEARCPQCAQTFANRARLVEHVTTHAVVMAADSRIINPAKPFKCETCYKCFASNERLERHMMVHGAEELKPLQCDVCFKRFLNNSALTCHLKIHTGKKAFECPICKETFEHVLALKDHVQIHSTDGLFTCPHCSKVFDGYCLIRKHIRAFHNDRKHVCICCGKPFPTQDKLRMHMLKHSDHREFLCANCGKQFKRKDKLKEHMKRMHSAERERHCENEQEDKTASLNNIKEKSLIMELAEKVAVDASLPGRKNDGRSPSQSTFNCFIYKCHTCLVGFKRRGMLVNHLAKRHPEIPPDTVPELNLPILRATRDYYCQYCEKVYKSSSKRKAHILKIHPGAELPLSNRRKGGIPEIPGLPDPTFSQTVGSVTTHPHGCQWCHKQYASKAKLLQHQRKKHIELLPPGQQLPRGQRTSSSSSGNPPSPAQSGSGSSRSPQHSTADNYSQLALTKKDHSVQDHDDTVDADNGHTSNDDLLVDNVINIVPGDYEIAATAEDLQQLQESGIIIDASALRDRAFKELRLTVPGGHFLRVAASPWQQQAIDSELVPFAAAEPPR